MNIIIELRRVGASRVSEETIPLMARVFSNGRFGANLIASNQYTDIECAKVAIQDQLNKRFRMAVAIEWIDATREGA